MILRRKLVNRLTLALRKSFSVCFLRLQIPIAIGTIGTIGTACLLLSCDSNRLYENNIEFADRSWNVMEEPRFDFIISDTAQRYNVYFNVRNSLDYPYARIFVTYHLYDSTGKELLKKLVNNDLFNQKTGQPLGESGLGDLYDHQFLLLNRHRFDHLGKYSVKLDQFMRRDTLQGVIAVGLRVEMEPQK